MTQKILFIVGSNRKTSFNCQLAGEIIAMIGERAKCSVLDYSDVPMLNQDAEYPASEAVTRLRDSVADADALWIITPEYNASYPGLLKNVLDWLSRPIVRNDYATPTVLRGKKATISGAGGKSAAVHARKKLAQLLGFIGVDLFKDEGNGVALGAESFDSDTLIIGEDLRKSLKEQVDGFLAFIMSEEQFKIVAYLDLLGFSNHVKKDSEAAARQLEDIHTVLGMELKLGMMHPVSSYLPELQESAKINASVTSIDYFLPFSDSVFLMSSDCNSFVLQLCNLIYEHFMFKADFYINPANISEPEKISYPNIEVKNGELVISTKTRKEYPILFRGGLAYGEAFPKQLNRIVNNEASETTILVGKAVVDAVRREKPEVEGENLKGPRLFLGEDVFKQLNEETRLYCRKTPECPELYELLWPAIGYLTSNDLNDLIFKFDQLILPVYNLWKAYQNDENDKPVAKQYDKFIDLIISSTIQFFDKKFNKKQEVRDRIKDHILSNMPELRKIIDPYGLL